MAEQLRLWKEEESKIPTDEAEDEAEDEVEDETEYEAEYEQIAKNLMNFATLE